MYHDPSWDSLVVSPAQQYERARAARQRLNRVPLPRPAPVVKALEVVAPVEPPKVEDVSAECEEIDAAPAWCPPPLDLLLALNGVRFPRVVYEKTIKQLVADEFNVTVDELIGETRARKVVGPRQVAIYLLRTISGWSYPRIGRAFGDRDHTTAYHAVQVIERGILAGSDLGRAASFLKARLLAAVESSGQSDAQTNRPDAVHGTPAGPVATA